MSNITRESNGFYTYDFDRDVTLAAITQGTFQTMMISGNIGSTADTTNVASVWGAGIMGSESTRKHTRTILRLHMPDKPSENGDFKITEFWFYVKTGDNTGVNGHGMGGLETINVHPLEMAELEMDDVAWEEYDSGVAWAAAGAEDDLNSSTNYGFGANGIIGSHPGLTAHNTGYWFNLSAYVDNLDWGKKYMFIFKTARTDNPGSPDRLATQLATVSDSTLTCEIKFTDSVPEPPQISARANIGGQSALIDVKIGSDKDLSDCTTVWTNDASEPEFQSSSGDNDNIISDSNPVTLNTANATHFDAGILSSENLRYRLAVYSRDMASTYVDTTPRTSGISRSNIIDLARPNINSVVINSTFNTIGVEGQLTVAATTGGAWSSYGAASLKYLHILWDGPSTGATTNDDGVAKIEITDTDATSIVHKHTYSSAGTKYVWVALEDTDGFMSGFHRIDDADTQFTVGSASYNNDPTITHASSTAIKAGMYVSGSGIPAGAYVASVTDATHFELSVSTTGGSKTGQTLTFNWIDTLATLPDVSEANPICNVTTSKSKFLAAKYADFNTGLIVSAGQSKAIGSNRKLQNYLFTCKAGKATTLVTVNAFDNDNSVFDDSSKRVAVRALTDLDVSSARLKVTGLASFASDGDPVKDNDSTFTNYKMMSETIGPPDAVMTQGSTAGTASGGAAYNSGNFTYNYFKTVESAVFTTTDATDTEGIRYILTAYTGDWSAHDTGVTISEADDGSELGLTVTDATVFRSGDVVRIDSEYMKVTTSDTDNNRISITRQYLGSASNSSVGSGAAIYLANPIVINSDLRFISAPTDADFHDRYRWGGFARILGNAASGDGIDFEPYVFGDSATNTIILNHITAASSSFDDTCWYENGFFDDDIIMVGNTTDNGTYASPKFYKLASFTTGGSSNYETAFIHGSSHDLPSWVENGLTNEDDEAADIVRVISNPSRTVAAINTANEEDVITFEARVIDDDTTSFLLRTDLESTSAVLTQPEALDLGTVATYGTHLTTSDIAILGADMARDGGLATVMPLGERKYPVGLTRTTMGLPTMTVNIRVLSQTGYKSLLSLIEGDTYDYVFMDSTQVDTPTSAYVTFRMKYVSGNLRKSPEITNEYLATLNFVIVGEAVTV
tara:strand:+ start:1326 stop:4733 length:3408 start_codon:yes stop_codon:yes gene_type:complete